MISLEDRLFSLEKQVETLKAEIETLRPSKAWKATDGVVKQQGARVHPTCVIIASDGRTVNIGKHVLLRRGAEIVGPVSIGERSSFNRDVYIRSNVTIGKNCNVGAFVRFLTDSHEVGGAARRAGKGSFPPIVVGDGTWVGAGSIILGGVTIGESCIIAAGSVVNRDVPANTMVGGVPAKHIKDLP